MKVTAAAIAVFLTALVAAGQTFQLQSTDGLELLNVKADIVTYRGRKAVHLVENVKEGTSGDAIAIIRGTDFRDGVIEAEIAGVPAAGAAEGARGFVGIAFRVKDISHYEAFYLRPTNGRAEDQLRRNHSTQYISHPDYPWHRLRRENPGVYESYVDLVPGEWTKIRVVVSGNEARLFVHGSEQPVLIVKDMKHGESNGRIALWIGSGTEAWFSSVTVKGK
jgi:hypothetical protein